MTINPSVLLVLVMTALAVDAAPGLTQTTDGQPAPAGVFGSTPNADARQTLDVTVSLITAYDSGMSVAAAPVAYQFIDPYATVNSNMYVGSVDYGWRRRDVQFRTSGASTLRHDRRSGDITTMGQTAAAGLTARLSQRNALSVNQTAVYSPSYLYNLFPPATAPAVGEAPPTAADRAVADFGSYSYGTQLTLNHDFTRRTNVSIAGDYNRAEDPTAASGQPDLETYGTSGTLTRALGPNTTANGRYRYRTSNFAYSGVAADGGISEEHSLEVGLTHAWLLSRTRRMNLNVTLGRSVVIPLQPPGGEGHRGRAYGLIGQVGLGYVFGRAWQASATYRQAVDYVPGLIEPVATGGFTARIDGLITRRVQANLAALYSSGRSAFQAGGTTFDTYAGNARLRYALARGVAVYVEYLYFFYDFRRAGQLAPGIPPALERHSGRAGLTLLIPALRR